MQTKQDPVPLSMASQSAFIDSHFQNVQKGGYGSREVNILIKRAILGFARDLTLEGFPGPRRGPQIVPWAAEERVPELALAHNHTDEYFACHHRTFIWRWMEIETETHIGTLDLTP